jgi:hypothetical protein
MQCASQLACVATLLKLCLSSETLPEFRISPRVAFFKARRQDAGQGLKTDDVSHQNTETSFKNGKIRGVEVVSLVVVLLRPG